MLKFFDKLEDIVRGWLSHVPIVYGFIAGVGIVLFWRGVWHTADYTMMYITVWSRGASIGLETGSVWWDGPLSLVLGAGMLLISGSFVSSFLGNEIILSGLRGEKKLTERTEKEVRGEIGAIADIRSQVTAISLKLDARQRPAKRPRRARGMP